MPSSHHEVYTPYHADFSHSHQQRLLPEESFPAAMPSLTEGIFSQSITYLCEHGETGAMGIIINQPLELSIAEIFEHLEIRPAITG